MAMDKLVRGSSVWFLRSAQVLGLVGLLLALSHRFLPMNDAPSHIANAVIANKLLGGDGFFAAHYKFDLIPVPYWATALLMLLLQKVLPPLVAWKVLIGGYLVLLPLSLWVLFRALTSPDEVPSRSEVELPPLLPIAVLTVFHWGYWMGESNYLLGQPVALLALALLIRSRKVGSLSFVGFAVLATLSYICHIYALTLLSIAASAWAALALLSHKLPSLSVHRLRISHVIGLAWIYLLFAVAAYFVLFQHGSDSNRGSLGFDLSLRRLVHMMVDPFDSPEPPSRVWLAGLYVSLGAVFVVAQRQALTKLWAEKDGRWATLCELVHPSLLFPGLVVLLAAYLGPVSILAADGTQKEGEIAIRFVLGGFLLKALSLRLPKATSWKSPQAALAVVTLLFAAAQLHSAHKLHTTIDDQLQRIDAALLSRIPPHSRVLPLLSLPEAKWRDFLVHRVGNYVVLRDSYSPHVFAVRGQHALRHLPWGDQREVANLTVTDEEWRFYDYVLLQSRTTPPTHLLAHLVPIATVDDFQLWQVRKDQQRLTTGL